jgi:hypothetical protein
MLNQACSSAVLVLEKQRTDIKKLIQARRKIIESNAVFEGDRSGLMQKLEADPDMSTLRTEQRRVERRCTFNCLHS